jgi:hypothetical protein
VNAIPCSHYAPESCRYCDGTAQDERDVLPELWAASRDAEKARAKRMADPRQRAAWLASLPPLTRALIEPTHHVEEAS